jgi:hypothetical protein
MTFVATAEEGITWGIDVDGEVWRWLEGEISIEEVVDNVDHHWIHVPERKLIAVDVGYNSEVLGIEANTGDVLFREGITADKVMGTGWASIGTDCIDATVCDNGQMWASRTTDMLFRTGIVLGVTNQGSDWGLLAPSGLDGFFKSISCGSKGKLVVVSSDSNMYYRTEVNALNWQGTNWEYMDTGFKQVSVGGDGCIWAIFDGTDNEGKVYQRTGIVPDTKPFGDSWATIDHGLMKFR